MYYDDPYDPNLPNEYDEEPNAVKYYDNEMGSHNDMINDNDNDCTSTSNISVNKFSHKRRHAEMKNSDPGYFIVKRYPNMKSSMKQFIKIGYYMTNRCPGASIRNAVSGLYESNHKVGSIDEDLFFKVAMCTGENKTSTNMLFYDSPEQYERHFMCSISTATKDRWNDKSMAARLAYSKTMKSDNTTKYIPSVGNVTLVK